MLLRTLVKRVLVGLSALFILTRACQPLAGIAEALHTLASLQIFRSECHFFGVTQGACSDARW